MAKWGPTRRRTQRGLSLGLRTFVVGPLALALFIVSAMSGLPYAWCVPMAQVQLRDCCPSSPYSPEVAPGHDHAAHGAKVDAPPCCESHRVTSLPRSNAAGPTDVSVPPTPLVAVLSFALLLAGETPKNNGHAPCAVNEPRAGPEPPLFALYRSYLN